MFCFSNGVVKLGDLNVSTVMKDNFTRTRAGTPFYTSPEIWNNTAYDFKCDIWSLGWLIYELAAGRPPFLALSEKKLYQVVMKGKYPKIPLVYSNDLVQLIDTLL